MKKFRLLLTAMLLVTAQTYLLPVCRASNCDTSARVVGVFGAEGQAPAALQLDPKIQTQLVGLHAVRRIVDTKLTGSDERIVVYDSGADDYDPHPHVAILIHGRVVKIFDEIDLNRHAGGFERYLGSCEFNLTRHKKAFAVALSAGGDGAASAFAVIGWRAGSYRVIFDPMVGEGRMDLGLSELRVWDSIWAKNSSRERSRSEMEFECVWCPHRYSITEYRWNGSGFLKTGSQKTVKKYDPARISGTSFTVR